MPHIIPANGQNNNPADQSGIKITLDAMARMRHSRAIDIASPERTRCQGPPDRRDARHWSLTSSSGDRWAAAWKADTQQDRGSKPRRAADLLAGIRMPAAGVASGPPFYPCCTTDTAAPRKRPAPQVTRRKKRDARPVCNKRGTARCGKRHRTATETPALDSDRAQSGQREAGARIIGKMPAKPFRKRGAIKALRVMVLIEAPEI